LLGSGSIAKTVHSIEDFKTLKFSRNFRSMDHAWRPSLLHPDRLHALVRPGLALCGAELAGPTPEPARCTVCALTAQSGTKVPLDLRSQIEQECAENDEPVPARLLPLGLAKLDGGPRARSAAADALDTLGCLLADGYTEMEGALRVLRRAPGDSPHATLVQTHLVEALVAFNVTFSGYSRVDSILRHA
jgi:hypothetical protein